MTARIFLKLISGVLLILAVALAVADFLASKVAEKTYIAGLTRELADKGRMLALIQPEGLAKAAAVAGGRLTLIGGDGKVTFDSEANPAHMENHRERPEVRQALSGKAGSDSRLSNTMGVQFLYVAVPVATGALRIAVPLKDIEVQVNAIRRQLLAAVAISFLPAIVVAAFFARSVSAKLAAIIAYAGRLARGDFRARLEGAGKDELGILTGQLNETGEKLQKMFEELQREHEQLEKLERVRKDFVINVSHELRTPLASIQGYTETLLDGALHDPEHNAKFLGIIRENAERLGRLTADLMTLSRLELQSTRFQFASYRIKPLLANCVDSMFPMAQKKQIEISLHCAVEDAEVFCDSEAVYQIIANLLDNALKYTPKGGEITVGALAADPSGQIEIYVQDTGMGIPGDELPRLFERFYRVDKARSRDLGGTGLGLAIVKHLVRAQGGEVSVASQPNQGSRFSFTLPVQDLGLLEYGAVQPELTTL